MRVEFQKAIAFEEDLDKVNSRLMNEAKSNYNRLTKRINDDYQSAQLIRAGMKEPAESQIYKLAKAYFDTYRKNNAPKESVDGTGATIADLLEMESSKLEQTLQIKEIIEGKDDAANESKPD